MDSCTVLGIGKEVFKGSLEKVNIIYHLVNDNLNIFM